MTLKNLHIRKFFSRHFFDLPLWVWLIILVLSLIKLWLVGGQSISAFGEAGHDDRLFINLAKHITDGDWLGKYDQLTLAKGPFYPLWIAISFFAGIPLLLAQHLLYILASIVFIQGIKPILNRNYYLLLILYVVMLFNPMSYGEGISTRVVREGLYVPLVLLITSFSIGLLTRAGNKFSSYTYWLIGLGLSLSAFWLTREEGLWIIPFLVPIFLYLLFAEWKNNNNKYLVLLKNTFPIIITIFFLFMTSFINHRAYGIFNVVEYNNRDFLRAFGSMTRVNQEKWRPYILVPKETRMRLYNVSPKFAELQPYLEGNLGNNWAKCAFEYLKIDSSEIAGGWFMWAFRDAVAEAGYYKNGQSALGFYRKMADEINLACESGKIRCSKNRESILPQWRNEYSIPLRNSFLEDIRQFVRFDGFNAFPRMSAGKPESLDLFFQLTGEPIENAVDENQNRQTKFSGWAFDSNEIIILSVINEKERQADASIQIIESTDVFDSFLKTKGKEFFNALNSRFKISTSCQNDCFLILHTDSGKKQKVPIKTREYLDTGTLFAHIDEVTHEKDSSFKEKPRMQLANFKINILNEIGKSYRYSFPYLSAISLLIFAFMTFRISGVIKDRPMLILYIIALSSLLSILARLFILAVIDVMSFPTTMYIYFAPAHSLLIVFIISCFLLISPYFFNLKLSEKEFNQS